MKKDFSALSFSEKERICESIFIANGPYWHVYTDGTKMQNIFCCEEDFIVGMWCLASALHLCKPVRALTFELMGNHVHLILAGQREECIKAFDLFAARLRQAFPKRQRAIDWSKFKMDILPIESLQALRNEIIYTRLIPMGRRLCIFLSLDEAPDNHTIRRIADPDPTGPATYKENSTIQGFKSNRLHTIHPFFLRHQTRRKHVQGRPELFQLTHPQCRSIQPDSLQIKRHHLPHRRGTLLSHMLIH